MRCVQRDVQHPAISNPCRSARDQARSSRDLVARSRSCATLSSKSRSTIKPPRLTGDHRAGARRRQDTHKHRREDSLELGRNAGTPAPRGGRCWLPMTSKSASSGMAPSKTAVPTPLCCTLGQGVSSRWLLSPYRGKFDETVITVRAITQYSAVVSEQVEAAVTVSIFAEATHVRLCTGI